MRNILILSFALNVLLLFYIAWNKKYSINKIEDVLISYKVENKIDSTKYKTVFIGNSITANWINLSNSFFTENHFLNRGVGGQTSSLILLRFQHDVVDNRVKYAVLNLGINDIGEGDGFYDKRLTLDNLKSMIAICEANKIVPILTTLLPATSINRTRFSEVKDVQSKIEDLNRDITNLANAKNYILIDYNKSLRNTDGTFIEEYTFDGIHPNEKGYKVMEKLFLEATKQIDK